MSFLRATTPEHKESRRAQLLDTARDMLRSGTPLQELGLNELARQADMTKSNVYRYFESREHVLLELLRDEWSTWFETMTTTWREPPKKTPPLRHLVDHLARTVAARPLLCELTSALPTVLERNLSEPAIAEFKQLSVGLFEQCARFMAEHASEISVTLGVRMMNDFAAIVSGFWPYANPAPAVAKVIAADKTLRCFRRDFAADLSRVFHAVAADLVAS